MGRRYFVKRGSRINGPFETSQLQQLHTEKKLKANDQIGATEDGPWTSLASIYKDLFSDVEPELDTSSDNSVAKIKRKKKNLTSCEDCGNTVSTRAVSCPHCGAPLDAASDYGESSAMLGEAETGSESKNDKGSLTASRIPQVAALALGGICTLGAVLWGISSLFDSTPETESAASAPVTNVEAERAESTDEVASVIAPEKVEPDADGAMLPLIDEEPIVVDPFAVSESLESSLLKSLSSIDSKPDSEALASLLSRTDDPKEAATWITNYWRTPQDRDISRATTDGDTIYVEVVEDLSPRLYVVSQRANDSYTLDWQESVKLLASSYAYQDCMSEPKLFKCSFSWSTRSDVQSSCWIPQDYRLELAPTPKGTHNAYPLVVKASSELPPYALSSADRLLVAQDIYRRFTDFFKEKAEQHESSPESFSRLARTPQLLSRRLSTSVFSAGLQLDEVKEKPKPRYPGMSPQKPSYPSDAPFDFRFGNAERHLDASLFTSNVLDAETAKVLIQPPSSRKRPSSRKPSGPYDELTPDERLLFDLIADSPSQKVEGVADDRIFRIGLSLKTTGLQLSQQNKGKFEGPNPWYPTNTIHEVLRLGNASQDELDEVRDAKSAPHLLVLNCSPPEVDERLSIKFGTDNVSLPVEMFDTIVPSAIIAKFRSKSDPLREEEKIKLLEEQEYSVDIVSEQLESERSRNSYSALLSSDSICKELASEHFVLLIGDIVVSKNGARFWNSSRRTEVTYEATAAAQSHICPCYNVETRPNRKVPKEIFWPVNSVTKMNGLSLSVVDSRIDASKLPYKSGWSHLYSLLGPIPGNGVPGRPVVDLNLDDHAHKVRHDAAVRYATEKRIAFMKDSPGNSLEFIQATLPPVDDPKNEDYQIEYLRTEILYPAEVVTSGRQYESLIVDLRQGAAEASKEFAGTMERVFGGVTGRNGVNATFPSPLHGVWRVKELFDGTTTSQHPNVPTFVAAGNTLAGVDTDSVSTLTDVKSDQGAFVLSFANDRRFIVRLLSLSGRPRVGLPRPELPRPEPARPEPARPEPARPEPARPEPARSGGFRPGLPVRGGRPEPVGGLNTNRSEYQVDIYLDDKAETPIQTYKISVTDF